MALSRMSICVFSFAIALFGTAQISLAAPSEGGDPLTVLPPVAVSINCTLFQEGTVPQKEIFRKAGQQYDAMRPTAGAGDYRFTINWQIPCGATSVYGTVSGEFWKGRKAKFASRLYNRALDYDMTPGQPDGYERYIVNTVDYTPDLSYRCTAGAGRCSDAGAALLGAAGHFSCTYSGGQWSCEKP